MKQLLTQYLKYWLLPLVIGVVFGVRFLADRETQTLNIDEIFNIKKAPYLDLYLQGDFANPAWGEWQAYDQPMLVNYVYAVSFHDLAQAEGGYEAYLSKQKFVDDGTDYCPTNEAVGNFGEWWWCHNLKPLEEISQDFPGAFETLLRARTWAVVMMALLVVVIYLAGLEIGGVVMGIVSALWFGLYPLAQVLAPQAMIDQLLVLLTIVQFLALIIWVKYPKARIWSLVSLGVISGLVASAKLNGFLGLPLVSLTVLLTLGLKEKQWLRGLIQSGLVSFLALAIFTILNPYLWPNWQERFKNMIEWRITTGQGQQAALPEMAMNSPKEGFTYLKNELFYEWDFGTKTNGEVSVSLIGLLFGWFSLVAISLARWVRQEKVAILELLLLGFSLVMVLTLPFYIPMKWVRYLLPALPAVALIQGYVAQKTLQASQWLVRSRK